MQPFHPLRPYQQAYLPQLRDAIRQGHRRILLQGSTGSGKTRVAAEIARLGCAKHSRVLLLAPRRELIYQAAQAMLSQGVRPGLIMAGERPSVTADMQVASFDTLHARAIRSRRLVMPRANIVLVDEAHLSISKSRIDILNHYDDAIIIGLTATPARGDGRPLNIGYDHMILGPNITELVDAGHLVPLRYFTPTKPDLDGLLLNKDGDYIEAPLSRRMNQPKLVGDVVDNWMRLARDRSTAVFCVDRAHARAVYEEFLEKGVHAEYLDGETDPQERKGILARVDSGETRVVVNVFVMTYGLDIPRLSCVVLARPTKNIVLYLQMLGRIMRTFPGKKDGVVIDHAGAVNENGFADDFMPWSLDGTEKIKDVIEKLKQKKKEPKDIQCSNCHTVFRGRRDCPNCGTIIIPRGEPVPVHEADLVEVDRAEEKKVLTWEQKCALMSELKGYARDHTFKDGWVAHSYRKKTGEWPNDPSIRDVSPRQPGTATRNWVKSQLIRHAKRRVK